ncbi:MAG: restriction endonuclease subunit S [Acidobacteria bacterium]|nr:restriction endonuclease subunit S [Acidobacteriota bacterium]
MRYQPSGWAQYKVEELFYSFSGGTPSKSKPEYWRGDIPWVSSGEFNSDVINQGTEFITAAGLENSSAKLCRPGSVIVVVRSGILKHTLPVALSGRELAINQDIKAFDSGDEDLNRWLFLSLKNSAKEILGLNREGTTVQSVKYETLKEHQLAIPPLNEQRRILTMLEKLSSRVNAAQERLATIPRILKRFRQSVIDSSCAGTLTVDWRLKHNVEFQQLSGKLGSLARFIDYRGKTPRKANAGIPLITAKNIRPGYLSVEPREYIAENDYDAWMTRGFPNIGDVLITTEAPLGYVVHIDWTFKFALAQRVICLQFDKDIVFGPYAALVLQSTQFQAGLRDRATGTTVTGIKASRLKELSINFPSLDEQKEVVRRVDDLLKSANALEARYVKAKRHVDKLTQSILAKAFRGELVPQDPNDEPASVLLERVRQQRNGTCDTKVRSTTKRRRR